jgi:hypothetical protein
MTPELRSSSLGKLQGGSGPQVAGILRLAKKFRVR